MKKRRAKLTVPIGIANIKTTSNNTIITICDLNKNVLFWSSAGITGLQGARKGTPFASQLIAKDIQEKAIPYGLKSLNVKLRGNGKGREASIQALNAFGFEILSIEDNTPVSFNGCRPPKKRRL